jgi:hypothetical protein
MSCERYASDVIDHALGADISRDGARHLAECAACRAAFDRQRQSMLAIERDLAQLAAIEPSGDFAARVRTRVESRERVPAFWWLTSAVAAAAAVALVVTLVIQRADRGGDSQAAPQVAVSSPPPVPAPPVAPDVPALTPEPAIGGSGRERPATRTTRSIRHAGASVERPAPPVRPEGEVLVPPDQVRAIARLVALVRSGGVPDMPAAPAADPAPPVDLVIAPLTIDVLVVPDVGIPLPASADRKSLEKE